MTKSSGDRIDLFAHAVKALKSQPRTNADVCEAVGCHHESARRYLTALKEHGLIVGEKRKTADGRRPIVWTWQP